MKLFLIAWAAIASAQTTLTLSGPATARPGQTINLTLALAGSTPTGPAALQWSLTTPAGFSVTSATEAAAATAASKTLNCTAARTLCLLYGMNANVIGNGGAVALSVSVPAAASPGAAALPLAGVLASTAAGAGMVISAGTAYSVTILARADLNGDGAINATDVSLMATEAKGDAACTDDQNGDGKCDVIDVFIVILRSLGL